MHPDPWPDYLTIVPLVNDSHIYFLTAQVDETLFAGNEGRLEQVIVEAIQKNCISSIHLYCLC